MLTLEELKKDRETVSLIDWDLTPQEAYESYQIKSINSWKSWAVSPGNPTITEVLMNTPGILCLILSIRRRT